MTAPIVLLTEPRYENPPSLTPLVRNILHEDQLLAAALQRLGIQSVRVDWSRPDYDWRAVPMAVFRTTWDYFLRWSEFRAWLERVSRDTALLNPVELVRWNSDKHYLEALQQQGVPVIETVFVDRGTDTPLVQVMQERQWNEVVVKPAISGGGLHTYRVDSEQAVDFSHKFARLVASTDMLVQPFLPDVVATGEVTLVLFAGRVSHAVRKVAAPGEFRVQDDFGGTVVPHAPRADEIAVAEKAFAACPLPPAYGRADFIRDPAGQVRLVELEVIEPELWLRLCPTAAGAFAAAIAAQLDAG